MNNNWKLQIARLESNMKKELLFSFLKGILAGLSIGVGGFLYILMTFLVEGELGKVLGSLLFAVGLFTVCTFYLSLYTGKIGLIYEKKQSKAFYISLPIMLIGNAIGAVGLGYLCFAIFKDLDIMNTSMGAAAVRLSFNSFNDFLSCIIKSTLCGICVYLAVKCFAYKRISILGTGLLVLFVFIFVYSGFQHCIANMFYFSFANAWGGEAAINMVLCILFNSIGPVFGVLLVKALSPKEDK